MRSVIVNGIVGLVLKGDGTGFVALQFWELYDALVAKGCACQWPIDTVGKLFYLNLINLILHFQSSLQYVQPSVGCVDMAE